VPVGAVVGGVWVGKKEGKQNGYDIVLDLNCGWPSSRKK